MKYIHNFEERNARRHVIRVLEKKAYVDWDSKDEAHASTVAGTYEILAQLLKSPGMRFGNQNGFFIRAFGVSIQRTFRILGPLIDERIKDNGKEFLAGYRWLEKEARRTVPWSAPKPMSAEIAQPTNDPNLKL